MLFGMFCIRIGLNLRSSPRLTLPLFSEDEFKLGQRRVLRPNLTRLLPCRLVTDESHLASRGSLPASLPSLYVKHFTRLIVNASQVNGYSPDISCCLGSGPCPLLLPLGSSRSLYSRKEKTSPFGRAWPPVYDPVTLVLLPDLNGPDLAYAYWTFTTLRRHHCSLASVCEMHVERTPMTVTRTAVFFSYSV